MPDFPSLRNLLAAVFAVIAMAFAAHGSAATVQALNNCGVADTTFDESEQAFLGIINQYRASHGLAPLTVSVNLNRAATWMAQDLAAKNYFSHTDSSGRNPFNRIADCGGTYNSGENLAAGKRIDTAQAAFQLWRSSAGHNKNMLNPAYTQIGIARAYNSGARYGWYWATAFGVEDDGTRMSNSVSMVSPQPMTKLASTTMTFEWASTTNVQQYRLDIGTSNGGADVYSGSLGLAQKVTVQDLPWQSRTVYVRLWALVGGAWEYTDYVYTGADWYT